ncbi:exodeoxyribonuclease VII large subunit [Candidatus Saccharibacteria bacterium]|nr:exodeoxyribonuclease VII large subunit [Candidatus Saccharibacteria bacterium]
MTPKLSVSQFVAVTNQMLEYAYPSVQVEGEVSGFKVNQGKYVFFDLKDATASVGCFMMLWQMRTPLQDGMKVVVQARPKLTQWGKFSLTVDNFSLSGEGDIKKSLELLRQKLTKEGLFDISRKRPLPDEIVKIAVVSSKDAAGYADFIKILNERWGGLEIQLAHVQVQGEGAADQIIKAMGYFNAQPNLADVLVLIRGGGSKQDLAAFNDELLVRAVAASRLPVITGIGHETDETLADLVADKVASTPSNAAQLITHDKNTEMAFVNHATVRLTEVIAKAIDSKRTELRADIGELGQYMTQQLNVKLDYVKQQIRLAEQLNPENTLKRGYALLTGSVVSGGVVNITTYDKLITAEVKNVTKRK